MYDDPAFWWWPAQGGTTSRMGHFTHEGHAGDAPGKAWSLCRIDMDGKEPIYAHCSVGDTCHCYVNKWLAPAWLREEAEQMGATARYFDIILVVKRDDPTLTLIAPETVRDEADAQVRGAYFDQMCQLPRRELLRYLDVVELPAADDRDAND